MRKRQSIKKQKIKYSLYCKDTQKSLTLTSHRSEERSQPSRKKQLPYATHHRPTTSNDTSARAADVRYTKYDRTDSSTHGSAATQRLVTIQINNLNNNKKDMYRSSQHYIDNIVEREAHENSMSQHAARTAINKNGRIRLHKVR